MVQERRKLAYSFPASLLLQEGAHLGGSMAAFPGLEAKQGALGNGFPFEGPLLCAWVPPQGIRF